MKCKEIMDYLEQLSPKRYALNWDNVGLLVGRKEKEVHRLMIALDATKDVVQAAIEQEVDMLITHHPMIFSAMKQINEDDITAEKVLTLAENGICYYAMHTNFDIAGGMAELAAGSDYLNLTNTYPIEVCDTEDGEGLGRYGILPEAMTAQQICAYVKEKFHLPFVMLYQPKGLEDKVYEKIAVLPGAGKSNWKDVLHTGYELYLTGDFGHHPGLDAMEMGITVIDATHYGLEYIFIKYISDYLRKKMPDMTIVELDTGCPVQVM